jgi:hypothetical protein
MITYIPQNSLVITYLPQNSLVFFLPIRSFGSQEDLQGSDRNSVMVSDK